MVYRALSDLTQDEEHKFFLNSGRDADGTTRLTKFKASSGWIVICVARNSSGYQSFVHVHLGIAKQGWVSFLHVLKSFLMNHDHGLWHSSLQLTPRFYGNQVKHFTRDSRRAKLCR